MNLRFQTSLQITNLTSDVTQVIKRGHVDDITMTVFYPYTLQVLLSSDTFNVKVKAVFNCFLIDTASFDCEFLSGFFLR